MPVVGLITKSGSIVFGETTLELNESKTISLYRPIALSNSGEGDMLISNYSYMRPDGFARFSKDSVNMYTVDLLDDVRHFYFRAAEYVYEHNYMTDARASVFKQFTSRLEKAMAEKKTLEQLFREEYEAAEAEYRKKGTGFDALRLMNEKPNQGPFTNEDVQAFANVLNGINQLGSNTETTNA